MLQAQGIHGSQAQGIHFLWPADTQVTLKDLKPQASGTKVDILVEAGLRGRGICIWRPAYVCALRMGFVTAGGCLY